MALVFETNFENGSFIDKIGGLIGTPTNFTLVNTENGIANRVDPRFSLQQYVWYPLYRFVNSSFTIEAWIKRVFLETPFSQQIGPATGGSTGIGYSYATFEVYGSSGGRQTKTLTGLPFNRLTHRVITLDFSTRILRNYHNGILINTTTAFNDWGTITQANNRTTIGNSYASTAFNLNCKIFKVKIHEGILSENEILKSYRSFIPSINNKPIYVS